MPLPMHVTHIEALLKVLIQANDPLPSLFVLRKDPHFSLWAQIELSDSRKVVSFLG